MSPRDPVARIHRPPARETVDAFRPPRLDVPGWRVLRIYDRAWLPRDFAELAPLVVHHALQGDRVACDLMRAAARHVDALAKRLCAIGVQRIALAGGLSSSLEPWLGSETKRRLVPAAGDALTGALWLARAEAECSAPAHRDAGSIGR